MSYETVKIVPTSFTGPGTSYERPPEVLVCVQCGCMVWPTRISLHEAWHAKIEKLAATRNMMVAPPPQRNQGNRR